MARRGYIRRRPSDEGNERGQDSFLDIVSNIVGILIILVMIAGARVGSIQSSQAALSDKVTGEELTLTNPSMLDDPLLQSEEEKEIPARQIECYLNVAKKTTEIQREIDLSKKGTSEANEALQIFKQQADGAERQHSNLIADIGKVEALIENEKRKLSEEERGNLEQEQKLLRLAKETEFLTEQCKVAAQQKTPSKILENVPTPISKKVEGHEALFCIRNNKISHIPMNVFTERMRGNVRSSRDFQKNLHDDTIGPVDGYRFHYQIAVERFHHSEGDGYNFSFVFGECLPVDDTIGETVSQALSRGSTFERKLSMYLKDRSTITLFVYPDSYNELREIKKFLVERDYVIALRPMPKDQPVTLSPQGEVSVSY